MPNLQTQTSDPPQILGFRFPTSSTNPLRRQGTPLLTPGDIPISSPISGSCHTIKKSASSRGAALLRCRKKSIIALRLDTNVTRNTTSGFWSMFRVRVFPPTATNCRIFTLNCVKTTEFLKVRWFYNPRLTVRARTVLNVSSAAIAS